MTNEFTIIGEHKEDGRKFLVLGADGQYYDYRPEHEDFSPVEPDENWEVTGPDDPEIDGIYLAPRQRFDLH